jgi:hypothetical protein
MQPATCLRCIPSLLPEGCANIAATGLHYEPCLLLRPCHLAVSRHQSDRELFREIIIASLARITVQIQDTKGVDSK